jgi:hypothetical protein
MDLDALEVMLAVLVALATCILVVMVWHFVIDLRDHRDFQKAVQRIKESKEVPVVEAEDEEEIPEDDSTYCPNCGACLELFPVESDEGAPVCWMCGALVAETPEDEEET